MNEFYLRPEISSVTIDDSFWTPYLKSIREITLPYCFRKFGETGHVRNLKYMASGIKKSNGNPFSDGLLFETITGACRFLNSSYDERIDKKIDELIEIIASAQLDDGYLCSQTHALYPEKRWGRNDGNIVFQHDLYNHGTLIEAGVAHYKATKKITLLLCAVKAANLICSCIGMPPKYNVVPGHSLPEIAFSELYDLFADNMELDKFASENNVNISDYLEILRFWYDNRGVHEGREMNKRQRELGFEYNQDTAPFSEQKSAMGHAVRACLCYAGATIAHRKLNRADYLEALNLIWNDVVKKKLHISGGVGSRHDIEGFDAEYELPNDAYLETCAGIAFAFWAAEMNLVQKNSEYFDYFELSLYNNILGAIGEDFKNYYYDNALINDGTKNRWSWHVCPCCPPMLLKCYSSLGTYIYSYNKNDICINMYMGSHFSTADFEIKQKDNKFDITIMKKSKKISFRIPQYATEFRIFKDGKEFEHTIENGYACVVADEGINVFEVKYENRIAEICANTNVEYDKGMVCFMYGKYLMCAEGADNNGDTEFTVSQNSDAIIDGDTLKIKTTSGNIATLIPYYKRNNRVSEDPDDSKMAVWFRKEALTDEIQKSVIKNNNLYGYYNF